MSQPRDPSPFTRPRAWRKGWSLSPAVILAQTSDGILPEDPAARVVFVMVGAAIVGLYFVIRRTRRRADDAYWESRRREQTLRDNDPDMKRDEP